MRDEDEAMKVVKTWVNASKGMFITNLIPKGGTLQRLPSNYGLWSFKKGGKTLTVIQACYPEDTFCNNILDYNKKGASLCNQ